MSRLTREPHEPHEKWLLVALLLVAANQRPALASLGPVLEALRSELHLSHATAGLLNSIPIICMGVCAPLALYLQRRTDARTGIVAMLILLAVGITVRWYASATMQFVSAILLGISLAALGPLVAAFTKQHYLHSARVSAWSTTALCISASMGATLSAQLATHWHWSTTLAFFAIPAWLVAPLWWRVAPAHDPQVGNAKHAVTQTSPWRQWRGWALLLCFGTNSMVFYALLAWLAALFSDLHVSEVNAGYLLGWFALVQIAGPIWVSVAVKPMQDRRPLLWLFGICMLAGLIGLLYLPLHFTLLWLSLVGAGTAGMFATTMVLSLDFSGDARSSAAWTAMISTGGYLIAALGPWLFGTLREHRGSYDASLTLLIASTAVAVLTGALLAPTNTSTRLTTL